MLAIAAGCGRVSFEELPPRDAGVARDAGRPDDGGARDVGARADGGAPDGAAPDAGTPFPKCSYQCSVTTAGVTCTDPITLVSADGAARTLRVDMRGRDRLHLLLMVCDSTGWTFHLGDSVTNDGDGGDAGSSSHDAELQIRDRAFSVFDSDEGPIDETWTNPETLAASGCSSVDIEVRTDEVRFDPGDYRVDSPYLFSIDPPSDAEGAPDATWYIGLNRTWGNATRSGTGLVEAHLCIEGE